MPPKVIGVYYDPRSERNDVGGRLWSLRPAALPVDEEALISATGTDPRGRRSGLIRATTTHAHHEEARTISDGTKVLLSQA